MHRTLIICSTWKSCNYVYSSLCHHFFPRKFSAGGESTFCINCSAEENQPNPVHSSCYFYCTQPISCHCCWENTLPPIKGLNLLEWHSYQFSRQANWFWQVERGNEKGRKNESERERVKERIRNSKLYYMCNICII